MVKELYPNSKPISLFLTKAEINVNSANVSVAFN